jgi:diaminopimelate epimerase
MPVKFTKMHGAGNDFVMIDTHQPAPQAAARDIRRIADRRLGVGCDQVLLVEAPGKPGRGLPLSHLQRRRQRVGPVRQRRALLRPLRTPSPADAAAAMVVETSSGTMTLTLLDNTSVEVAMGAPRFDPRIYPCLREARSSVRPAGRRRAAAHRRPVPGQSARRIARGIGR